MADCWRWYLRVGRNRIDELTSQLEALGYYPAIIEQVQKRQALLEVYAANRSELTHLKKLFGGGLVFVPARKWLKENRSEPIRIAPNLFLAGSEILRPKKSKERYLVIPAGMAFGTGEHATTGMAARELARRLDSTTQSFLDAGTGSGVLALLARLLGCPRVDAFDFDPVCIRVARENEKANFPGETIKWKVADITRVHWKRKYHTIAANLYSELLVVSSGKLASWLYPGGILLVSGLRRDQESEVKKALSREKLKCLQARRRGKWVMMVWQKPERS